MSTPSNPVVREAQTVENYNASAKQKAAAKLSRIPVKVEQGVQKRWGAVDTSLVLGEWWGFATELAAARPEVLP